MSNINVNGKTLQTTHQTVQLVVNELGLSTKRYAVEVDGELIPRQMRWGDLNRLFEIVKRITDALLWQTVHQVDIKTA